MRFSFVLLLPLLAAGCTPPANVAVERQPVTEEVQVVGEESVNEIEQDEVTADPLLVEEVLKMVPASLAPSSVGEERVEVKKETVVAPPAPKPVVTAPSCNCPAADLDCTDFDTQEEAQAMHDCCVATKGWDSHRLDGNDNDGLACESLP